MTLSELNEHYRLRRDLQKAEELYRNLLRKAEPGGQELDGMPHATGAGNPVESLGIELTLASRAIKNLKKAVQGTQPQVENFIGGIEDLQIQLVFYLRFLRGHTWGEIATALGGGNTEDGIKKMCYRYLPR